MQSSFATDLDSILPQQQQLVISPSSEFSSSIGRQAADT